MTTTANGWRLDDIRLRAAFRRLSELDFPLLAHPALEPLPDVYADFALTASVSPVVSTVGAGRLCLGTDYPFRGALRRAVDDVRSQALPAGEESAILGGNVARWFS